MENDITFMKARVVELTARVNVLSSEKAIAEAEAKKFKFWLGLANFLLLIMLAMNFYVQFFLKK